MMDKEKSWTFVIDSKTKITKGKAAMTFGDLRIFFILVRRSNVSH